MNRDLRAVPRDRTCDGVCSIAAVVAGVEAVVAVIGSAGAAVGAALGGTAIADFAGAALVDAAVGAGLGAGEAALTGGNILKGAEFGGITGGFLGGFGPLVAGATGLPAVAADALVGAAGGALGAEATGMNPLTGALEGGVGGFVSGALQPGGFSATPTGGSAAVAGGGATSAAGAAPPGGLSADDLSLIGASPAASTSAITGASTSALPGDVGAGAAGGGGTGVSGLPAAPTVGDLAPQTLGASGAGGAAPIGPSPSAPITAPGAISSTTGAYGSAGNPVSPGEAAFQSNFLGGDNALTSNLSPNSTMPPPAIGGAAGAGGATSGLGKMFSNPMTDLTALAFGADILKGQQKPAYESQIASAAATDASLSSRLTGYELSGTLPPGVQASLDTASQAAAASIRSQYASRGMSGSSAEAQDLQNLGLRVQGQGQQIAAQLFSQGIQEAQLSDQLYVTLMNTELQQDQQLQQGVSGLAAALAGFSRPVTYLQPAPTGG